MRPPDSHRYHGPNNLDVQAGPQCIPDLCVDPTDIDLGYPDRALPNVVRFARAADPSGRAIVFSGAELPEPGEQSTGPHDS